MARPVRAGRGRRASLVVGLLVALTAGAGCGGAPDVEIEPGGKGPRVEWGEPSGDPRGVVILLHGGGWQPSRRAFEQQQDSAANLREDGYATVVIGYGEGAQALRQIERIYSQARERYPDLPICASGISAGGHLALMLATRKPDLACVVNLAGPADLTTLAEQGGSVANRKAIKAFGRDERARYSPIRFADQIRAKVLMVLAEDDPVNPVEQGSELKQALPDAELFVLPPGSTQVPLFHLAKVTPESYEEATMRIVDFLNEATEGS